MQKAIRDQGPAEGRCWGAEAIHPRPESIWEKISAAATQVAILLLCEVLECDISNIILQNHAISSALDEYALKTSLGVRNGLLGVENGAEDFGGLFFYEFYRGAHQLGIWSHMGRKVCLESA